jgi:glycosyltransferase involved in cell wall biosynthesis
VNNQSITQVVCICGGVGFPVGTASSQRIVSLGSGIVAAGGKFDVLHIGPSVVTENLSAKGFYLGMFYEYLPAVVKASQRRWLRILLYIFGAILLPLKLKEYPSGTVAYIYYQGSIAGLWSLLWCRILRMLVIQEACEWWPETNKSSTLVRFMYQQVMFKYSHGAFAISKAIEERIKVFSSPEYPIYRLPILAQNAGNKSLRRLPSSQIVFDYPYFLWCGSLNAYQQDIKFLIQAFSEFRADSSRKEKLVLVGPASNSTHKSVERFLDLFSLEVGDVIVSGFVEDSQLNQLCCSATSLLLPMWCDPRSETRFPSKVALYLKAGRPIITSPVGAIAEHFRDRETALFYESGSAGSLADLLRLIVDDRMLGDFIGNNARKSVLPRFDYILHGKIVLDWLDQYIISHK